MRKFLYVCLTFFLMPGALYAASGNGTLEFVGNKGQWPEPFSYKVTTGGSDVFLEKNAFTYLVGAPDNYSKIQNQKFGITETTTLNFHAYKMVFVGGNLNPVLEEKRSQQHYYNYYLGSDANRWKSGIHPCLEVDYRNIYNNIDLHVSSAEKNLKYDFIVAPGADPALIQLRYDGAEKVSLKDGKLQILTTIGTVEEMKPYAYQEIDGQQVKVFCRYKLSNNTVTYSFPDGYDKSKELVIDPTVVFATFSGSAADNWGFTATYDAGGNFYAGGLALGVGYPITTGAFQPTWGNGAPIFFNNFSCDISISKFNSSGSALVYSTYLGGNANEQPHSLIVDAAGNLVVAGRTYSTNFPTSAGCYDNSYNGSGDLTVTKFNSTGTALVGSTFVGGSGQDITNGYAFEFGWGALKHNYGDDARSEVILDQGGNIYIAACTRSTNFPTTADAIKTTLNSADTQDAVVLELNSSLTSLMWSTYLGGDADDAAYVLTLDKTDANLFVAGGTMSNNFPATSGGYTSAYQGNIDGFISKFSTANHSLTRSTYIGRSGYDQCYGIQIDNSNDIYAMGQTMGGTFPVSSGVYSNPGSSQFIIKMNSNLTTNLVSTVFGSGNPNATNISPAAFLVDSCENIYVSGWGGNLFGGNPPPGTGTTFGMPINGSAGPAAQSTTDGSDFYFIVLSRNMGSLVYGTFMGANGGVGEHVDGGTSRFDKNGIVYQAICGGCGGGTFPTTAGSHSVTNKSTNCNLVALKIAFDLGPVKADFSISPTGVACLGTPFTFVNKSVNGISFQWDFGDGTPVFSGTTPPAHTYANVGTYTIRLRASNPNACNSIDSAKTTVRVDTNSINAAFKATIIDTCAPYTASFANQSKLSSSPGGTVFNWNFGDGTTSTAQNPPNKNYPGGGSFTVTLVMTDPASCNSPDSASTTLTFRDDVVKAAFDVPELICLGDSFAPSNTSERALTYLWKFGDGKTSTQVRPFHKFDTTGVYTVTLIAYNPESCNKVDSIKKTIEIKPSPFADFSFSPIVPVTNEISKFKNLSKNAVSYNWNFGDGEGSFETDPEHFYKRTGSYLVCLVAMNKEGCTDTTCKYVPADVLPLADIPNAFSPNGDGNNDLLFVYGAAIERMNVKVYNRWGQMVFESNDMKHGWDGTFKGKPQEMEVYAYVLNVTFIDNTTLFKKGNVTLLR